MNLGTMEAGDTKDEIFANDPYYETLHKIIACFLTDWMVQAWQMNLVILVYTLNCSQFTVGTLYA